jgi:hypothetical protein
MAVEGVYVDGDAYANLTQVLYPCMSSQVTVPNWGRKADASPSPSPSPLALALARLTADPSPTDLAFSSVLRVARLYGEAPASRDASLSTHAPCC